MNGLRTIEEFLRAQSTLTLATISEDGTPYATPLFYIVAENLQIYWLSSKSSMHSVQVTMHPGVSAAIYAPADEWKKIHGVQIWGLAQAIRDSNERKTIIKAYISRFRLSNLFRGVILACDLYRLSPVRIRYINNSKHFGYKREIVLPA